MTTTTYSINLTDSEQTPAWMALCATATPGAQDSGRVRYTVTTEQPAALEAALNADADVLTYEAQEGGEAVTEAVHLIERSVRHAVTARAAWSQDLADALAERCDDSADNGPTVEFWGHLASDEGDAMDGTWRVHLTR